MPQGKTKSHPKNKDTFLALATANQVSASDLRVHLDDDTLHRIINDSGITAIELFSAAKIILELLLKEDAANKNVNNGYAPLDGSALVPLANLPDSVKTGSEYKGSYNASTNTPTIINGTGANGDYHRVAVAGTQDFGAGNITFFIGDIVVYNGTTLIWQRVAGNPDFVQSVAGKQGVVTLDTNDVLEALNLYYTETRVSNNADVSANTTHRGITTGNPHDVKATQISDFDTEVSNNSDVTANTSHRNTVTGNPHNVLATQITDFDSEVSNNVDVAASKAVTDEITVTQPVNLDIMESDIEINKGYLETTLIEGGVVTINADPTKIDIATGRGRFVTQNLDGTSTISEPAAFPTTIAFDATASPPFDGDSLAYLTVDSSGTFAMNQLPLNFNTIHTKLPLSFLQIVGGVVVNATDDLFFGGKSQGISQAFNELVEIFGYQNLGVSYLPNTNLSFQLTGGDIWKFGVHWHTNRNSNKIAFIAQNPVPFRYSFRDGAGGFGLSAILTSVNGKSLDDDSGTFPNTLVANNDWTNQRIHLAPAIQVSFIELGQTIYGTSAAAIAAIINEEHIGNPAANESLFIGVLTVRGAATNLSLIPNDAVFTPAPSVAVGATATSSVTMQNTYQNTGNEPEILTNATRKALSVQRGSLLDTDNVYEGLNGAGAITFFVTGNGDATVLSIIAGNLMMAANAISSLNINGDIDLVLDGTGSAHINHNILSGKEALCIANKNGSNRNTIGYRNGTTLLWSMGSLTTGQTFGLFDDVTGEFAFNITATQFSIPSKSFLLNSGAAIDEFSTDGTLAGNSDLAVPTEKAVKTYVDILAMFAVGTNTDTSTNLNIVETTDFDTNVPLTGGSTISGDFTVSGGGYQCNFTGVIEVTGNVHIQASEGRINVQIRILNGSVSEGPIGNTYIRNTEGVNESTSIVSHILSVTEDDIITIGARREPSGIITGAATMAVSGTSNLLIRRIS